MHITVKRHIETKESTIGSLRIDGRLQCYTLEDPYHKIKVIGETRIPEGEYKLALRTYGGFHQRYNKKFAAWHDYGMIEIMQVPNYTNILIHIGNWPGDTEGCLLLGQEAGINAIHNSTKAYRAFYKIVATELSKGKSVTLHIS